MSTLLELSSQWQNPSDVTSILMVIGGDVVQKALAQATGKLYAPVCFSFGWVSYAFVALVNVLGDGRLLPPPDYRVKVINLKSGYSRDNKNWVIGRILRDHERWVSRRYQQLGGGGIRITVFNAVPTAVHQEPKPSATRRSRGHGLWRFMGRLITRDETPLAKSLFRYSKIHVFGVLVMLVQLAIAALPIVFDGDWGIMLITAGGTVIALLFGALPQWVAEKLPNRQHSQAIYGLTSGNGSRDIMVIKGLGHCLDLEEFCASDTPRNPLPWDKPQFTKVKNLDLPQPVSQQSVQGEKVPTMTRSGSVVRRPSPLRFGMPVGFLITLIASILQSILWLLLLVTVAALKSHTWYLVIIGALGMFQNGILAAVERRPEERGLRLTYVQTIWTKKVMDGLMDLEVSYGCGESLLPEFFPGRLTPEEEAWWNNDRQAYDDKRSREHQSRSMPHSRLFTNDLDRDAQGVRSSFGQDKAPGKDSPLEREIILESFTPNPVPMISAPRSVRFPKPALMAYTGDSVESQFPKGHRASTVLWSSTERGDGQEGVGRSSPPPDMQRHAPSQPGYRRSGQLQPQSNFFPHLMTPIPDVGPSTPRNSPKEDLSLDSNLSPPWS